MSDPRFARRREQFHLAALVAKAWELRGTPYLRDAADAILEAWDRRHLTRLEREQESIATLRQLLRETA